MNIQTQAYNTVRKPYKKDVQELLETLYAANEDEETRAKLASAYKFFMPAKPKKPKTTFEWLSMACGTEETRPYLHFIWCDGEGNAVSTNGHVMFITKTDKPKGFYDLQGKPIEHNETFPQWRRVIPSTTENVAFDPKPCGNNDYKLHDDDTFVFNIAYIDAALSYGKPKEVFWARDGSPLLFIFEDERRAVVMPKRSLR